MNIYEISEKFSISVMKLKRMHKAGVLVANSGDDHPDSAAMRTYLSNQQPLPVHHLFTLITQPEIMAELRAKQSEARAQIAALGDYAADKPKSGMLVSIRDATSGDAAALASFMRWLKLILPSDPVPYHWLAVRAMQGITDTNTRRDYQFIFAKALEIVRKQEEFAGWWKKEGEASRKRIFYFNPTPKNILDEYDL